MPQPTKAPTTALREQPAAVILVHNSTPLSTMHQEGTGMHTLDDLLSIGHVVALAGDTDDAVLLLGKDLS